MATHTHRGRHRQICILDRRGKWKARATGQGGALFWASALPKPNPPLEVFILFGIVVVVVVVASLKCFQFKFSEQNAF